ncbi:hypothetical protein Glove_196g93 [Diversispora epigaea]|uniref:TLDc domain-containing protein n=1 Tax=Diversispora epigaea TaxID=1348612 RepID=A0A397IP15_9GLOM|nr:hypothetical protein Glove_196g93 [Diversispora epigaea]
MFWDTCHGHASTVVIMKVKGTEEIFGGYNPLIWDANTTAVPGYIGSCIKADDSFIFSLKNGNIQNSILSRVKIDAIAFWQISKTHQKTYGPYFGSALSMESARSNFTLGNRCKCHNNGLYEKPIRTATTTKMFSIVDYEVFKVIKKTS